MSVEGDDFVENSARAVEMSTTNVKYRKLSFGESVLRFQIVIRLHKKLEFN